MAENDVDEKQLEEANEPQFNEALGAKKELEKHADQVPGEYRGEEKAYVAAAEKEVKSEEQATKASMRKTAQDR